MEIYIHRKEPIINAAVKQKPSRYLCNIILQFLFMYVSLMCSGGSHMKPSMCIEEIQWGVFQIALSVVFLHDILQVTRALHFPSDPNMQNLVKQNWEFCTFCQQELNLGSQRFTYCCENCFRL